jgi:uncharacterized membrane protein YqiK
VQLIGTELNGYVLDDSAIDFLEQTPLDKLNKNNILDAEGIKKITDLTARQQILANQIERDKEKTITKQNVEAREAILELERQKAEAEAKRSAKSRPSEPVEQAETVSQARGTTQSRTARLITEEEVKVVEENVQRQVIVAQRNKERTDAVETERIEKDRLLERTERERTVALAQIDKDKAIEVERRAIQEVIRDRVMVERGVVEEEEKIQDTKALPPLPGQTGGLDCGAAAEKPRFRSKPPRPLRPRVWPSNNSLPPKRPRRRRHTEAKKLLAEAKSLKTPPAGWRG